MCKSIAPTVCLFGCLEENVFTGKSNYLVDFHPILSTEMTQVAKKRDRFASFHFLHEKSLMFQMMFKFMLLALVIEMSIGLLVIVITVYQTDSESRQPGSHLVISSLTLSSFLDCMLELN